MIDHQENSTLADFGEMRLINEVILPLGKEFDLESTTGDDCTYVCVESGTLAVTADVGPKPLLHSVPGYDQDFEAVGWLAVVATASDVATAGAKPLFVTNCIDAPPEMLVVDFAAVLRGYFKACANFGFRNGGGDVRHGPTLSLRVFGAGTCNHDYRIGRSGATAGDQLVVIGPAGVFMATYLLAAAKHPGAILGARLTSDAERILRYPRPQLYAMELLANNRFISAASDTSDGLLGAIDNLARASGCGFELPLNHSQLHPLVVTAAKVRGINPWNVFFAWGDWSVAATVPAGRFDAFGRFCEDNEIQWCRLGSTTDLTFNISASVDGGQLASVIPLRNENFIARGFNAGVERHLDYMLSTKIFRTDR